MGLALVALEGQAVGGGVPPVHLALPVLTTLAIGRPFLEARLGAGTDDDRSAGFRTRARAALGFLPAALRVPDRYVVDVAERAPAGFAAPIDHTTYLAFNLLPGRLSRAGSLSVSLTYATEGVRALRETSRLVGLNLGVEF
jgi:hypothetical protein